MDIYVVSPSPEVEDEYEKLVRRMNPPQVVVDNQTCKNATVVQVHSTNRPSLLLEIVQVLSDLDLVVTKAHISSDGRWFMDVFKVTDQDGNKIFDQGILDFIQKALGPDSCLGSTKKSISVTQSEDHTAIELTGCDRPGLLSEISAVLTHLKCNVLSADLWTHNSRVAAVMHVTDEVTGSAVSDPDCLSKIKELLHNVLRGWDKSGCASTTISHGVTLNARRLHQMMLADRDYEGVPADGQRPKVEIVDWHDKDYSIVTIRSKDRPKLLFDTVCTLTDMQYVVFHASIDTEGPEANQEYYIRHKDGSPVKTDAERERLVRCLVAAIQRRASQGLRLELCTSDRVGLLSNVTRIFRENSLTVTRAEVATKDGKALNTFYVNDMSGNPVDSKTIECVRKSMGEAILKVKGYPPGDANSPRQGSFPSWFVFGRLFRS
ncbi:hypothetical protein MLD38_037971 [Melastoma candidum]|uniref:Uncharacterized protein n=1 Tax=Melastoma candidum TaxID=119954 RepID=A0ACB9KY34_9MYRT|nr:hypothetical protein MLD38_037971 [Melastoma candidum]